MAHPQRTLGQVRRTPPRPRQTMRTDNRGSSRPAHAPLRTHPSRTRPPGPPMMKPCIDCGTPANGTRCPQHTSQRQAVLQANQTARRQSTGGRSKYGGNYAGRGRAVRANATVCWLCGSGPIHDDPWQADHLIQGDRNGEGGALLPAHRSCNIRRRHMAGKGWGHERIVERLQLIRNGPPDRGRGQGHTPHPGHSLHAGTPDDPAPFDSADVSGVGTSGGGGS